MLGWEPIAAAQEEKVLDGAQLEAAPMIDLESDEPIVNGFALPTNNREFRNKHEVGFTCRWINERRTSPGIDAEALQRQRSQTFEDGLAGMHENRIVALWAVNRQLGAGVRRIVIVFLKDFPQRVHCAAFDRT